jgi:hypothetical protein
LLAADEGAKARVLLATGCAAHEMEVFGTTIKVFGDLNRSDTLTTEGSLGDGFLAG